MSTEIFLNESSNSLMTNTEVKSRLTSFLALKSKLLKKRNDSLKNSCKNLENTNFQNITNLSINDYYMLDKISDIFNELYFESKGYLSLKSPSELVRLTYEKIRLVVNQNSFIINDDLRIEISLYFVSLNVYFPFNEDCMYEFLKDYTANEINIISSTYPDITESFMLSSSASNVIENKTKKVYSNLKYLNFKPIMSLVNLTEKNSHIKQLFEEICKWLEHIQKENSKNFCQKSFIEISLVISNFRHVILKKLMEIVNNGVCEELKELVGILYALLSEEENSSNEISGVINQKLDMIIRICEGDLLSMILLYKFFIDSNKTFDQIIQMIRNLNQSNYFKNNQVNDRIKYTNKIILTPLFDNLGKYTNQENVPFWIQFMLLFSNDVLGPPHSHKQFEDYILLYFQSLLNNNCSSISIYNAYSIAINDTHITNRLKRAFFNSQLKMFINLVKIEFENLDQVITKNADYSLNINQICVLYDYIYNFIMADKVFLNEYFPFTAESISSLFQCFIPNIYNNNLFKGSNNKLDIFSHIILTIESTCIKYERKNNINDFNSLLSTIRGLITKNILLPFLNCTYEKDIDNCDFLKTVQSFYCLDLNLDLFKNCLIINPYETEKFEYYDESSYSYKIIKIIELLSYKEFINLDDNKQLTNNLYDNDISINIFKSLLRLFDSYYYGNTKTYLLPEFLFPCVVRAIGKLVSNRIMNISAEKLTILFKSIIAYSTDLNSRFFSLNSNYGIFDSLLFLDCFNAISVDSFSLEEFSLRQHAFNYDNFIEESRKVVSSLLINNPLLTISLSYNLDEN